MIYEIIIEHFGMLREMSRDLPQAAAEVEDKLGTKDNQYFVQILEEHIFLLTAKTNWYSLE